MLLTVKDTQALMQLIADAHNFIEDHHLAEDEEGRGADIKLRCQAFIKMVYRGMEAEELKESKDLDGSES